MAANKVSNERTEKSNNNLTDKAEQENGVHNVDDDVKNETNNEALLTGNDVEKNRKRKLNAHTLGDINVKDKGADMLSSEINQEIIKENLKVTDTSQDKSEIEESVRKDFFENLNKKKKIVDYDQEVYKESKFIIHYYEWAEIPDLYNLPYDLINKQNDELFKKYNTNYQLFISGKEKREKEEEKQQEKNEQKEEGKNEQKEEEKNEQKEEGKNEQKEEEKNEQKEEEKNEQKEEEKNEQKNEENADNDEECAHKKFMSSIVYEDIKMYFSKKQRTDLDVKNIKKIRSFIIEGTKEGESEMETDTDLKQQLEQIGVETDAEMEKAKKEESDWTMDFVALTNIQILGKHSNQFNEWKSIEILLPEIIDCCCSPRSSVCKNSFLAIKHLCMSWKNKQVLLNNLFVHIFPFVIKKLDVKNNFLKNCVMTAVEEFMLYGNTVNNYEMLRLICDHSNDKNAIITKHMAYYVYAFLNHLPKEKLKQFPLTELATPFVNFLHAKLEITRKYIKKAFSLLLKVKTEEEIIECFKNGISKKENFKIIEMNIRNALDYDLHSTGPSLKRSYSSFHEFRTMQRMGGVQQFSSN